MLLSRKERADSVDIDKAVYIVTNQGLTFSKKKKKKT
jgi:hypothetical protein